MGSGSDLVISFYWMSTGCDRSDLEMDRSIWIYWANARALKGRWILGSASTGPSE